MRLVLLFCGLAIAALGLGACAERSAPRTTFSGPDYITIKHDPYPFGPAPEAVAMAERYCAASGKSAVVAPYGRSKNATGFLCVGPGEEVK